MTSTASSVAGLSLEQLSLYHAVDPLLQSSIFVFHGPVMTANSTVSSSRIQAHVISLAGVQSYPRITVSPAAPLYAAVNHLPREKQGDEIYRGLAVSLLKYFSELTDTVKDGLTILSRTGKQGAKGSTRAMFDELHAAEVANKLIQVEDRSVAMEVVRDLKDAFGDRAVPWIDIDLIVPTGTIANIPQDATRDSSNYDPDSPEKFSDRFGTYSELIDALGEPIFLPTSKLKRAPSQPTNLSKSKVFSAAQKESLRLSMCEVVDTEERFVGKMYDLVHNVAQKFRQKAVDRPTTSTSPNEAELARLFPPCLNEILDVNMGFLNTIRQILEDTEQAALGDISDDTTLDSSTFPRDPTTGRRRDSMGAIEFANCLLDWFPRFSQPYAQYMHAHTSFSKVLSNFTGDQGSSFSKRVQEAGEQKMRSLLMEPIQRLPRYSLLIDAMTSSLPSVHPAVRPLLKARDTITEICSLDSLSTNNRSQSLQLLQRLVMEWPSSVALRGRLITTADICTIPVPHRISNPTSQAESGIMMVYTDYLILLSKLPDSKSTARGLYTDLDKPQPIDAANASNAPDLRFSHAIPISSVRATQSKCGRVLYLLPADNFVRNERTHLRSTMHALELASAYEGRAGKLIEEITKSRIEGRFPEHYRERGKWSLHNPGGNIGDTKTLVSVFEDEASSMGIPIASSTVKVVFGEAKASLSKESRNSGVEVLVSISAASPGRFKLDLESVVGVNSTDTFAAPDFVSVLSKRLHTLLRPLHEAQNPLLTDSVILSNFNILRVVAEQILGPVKATRSFRPPSPTKFLSSILGGGQPKDGKAFSTTPALGNVPSMPPPGSQNEALSSMSPGKTSSPTVPGINITDDNMGQLKQAEQVLNAYVLAIQSRRGNIVGRVLRSRDRADPAAVNELYNVLLEDPGRIQAAAEVPVDVLVVSFETFMRTAWKETMGPLIPANSLELIQIKFDSMFPGDFEDFFRRFLSEMTPQTRRALASLVKLLAQLLDASGNDGDRGALTAVFSEILTEEGDTRQYISLIDRLVEDYDRLFDDHATYAPLEGSLLNDPMSTSTRPRSQTASGSVNSNTSSFRKRFGFGLNRERSKTESEGKVSSIIRTLSKSKGSTADSDSRNTLTLPKDSLLRSKSTDVDTRLAHTLRPTSRDRPLIQTLFSSVEEFTRPDSSHSNASSHASHVSASERKGISPRKKRRSSLSDLRPLPAVDVTPLFVTKEPRRPITPVTNSTDSRSNSRPGTASDRSTPSRKLASAIDFNRQSPTRTPPPNIPSPTLRHTNSTRKENVPFTSPRAVNRRSNVPSALPFVSRRRGDSVSQSAAPRSPGLRERNHLLNGSEPLVSRTNSVTPATSTLPAKTMKLRMQNPQKLRERIQNEKKALASAETTLQAELASIGNELSNARASPTKLTRPSSSGANTRYMGSPSTSSSSTSTNSLLSRIRNLESKVTTLTSTLNSRTTSLENDIEDSLLVSERRARKLDELYREASAENEALYQRFNTELSRVTREIRAGGGEEVLRTQLREAFDEVARVKKENLRLKREVGGLKAQQVIGHENNGDFKGANGQ